MYAREEPQESLSAKAVTVQIGNRRKRRKRRDELLFATTDRAATGQHSVRVYRPTQSSASSSSISSSSLADYENEDEKKHRIPNPLLSLLSPAQPNRYGFRPGHAVHRDEEATRCVPLDPAQGEAACCQESCVSGPVLSPTRATGAPTLSNIAVPMQTNMHRVQEQHH